MNNRILISPSFLNSDFTKIEREIKRLELAGADMIHCDVMDGIFVPNISFGAKMVQDIKKITALPLDVHLMITKPERYVDTFIDAGADYLVLHLESTNLLKETLQHIKSRSVKCGVAISPDTPVLGLKNIINICDMVLLMSVHPGFGGQKFISASIERLKELKILRDTLSKNTLIEVDGGINLENSQQIVAAGADVIVAGSSLFNATDMKAAINQMKGHSF